jgi:hypothetical protein
LRERERESKNGGKKKKCVGACMREIEIARKFGSRYEEKEEDSYQKSQARNMYNLLHN